MGPFGGIDLTDADLLLSDYLATHYCETIF